MDDPSAVSDSPPASATRSDPATAPELIGVGSPLVDLVVSVDDAFLASHVEGAKGGMRMVDGATISGILQRYDGEVVRAAGGSASNTAVGAANLGIRAAFIGCAGRDDFAEFYRAALRSHGCDPRLAEHGNLPTGHVLSLVTPDAERTMRTCLGAAAAIDPAHFTPDLFHGARVVMLEGYTLFNRDLTVAVARAAKAAGARLALDLASFEVVQANRAVIDGLLGDLVDLVFANEDEATAWNAGGPEAALEDLAKRVPVVAVKLGERGALIARGGERVRVDAEKATAVDTTGAGDCWAAGFLAGELRGLPLEACGRLGAKAGSAVVQVKGAQAPRAEWLRIKGWLDAWA